VGGLPKTDIMGRFTRRKPVNVLTFEDEGHEITLDALNIEDGVIKDRLKSRAFIRADKPIYISLDKDFKRGRYPFYLADNNTGSTVTLKRVEGPGVTITSSEKLDGCEASFTRPKVQYEIVTNAEAVYNLLDNKLLFALLQIRPQMWQLLLMIVVGALLGFFIRSMWQ
jgi:hypothetical protein